MSEIHLSDLSKIYKEQIVEKKDDSYLEPDMKKRQTNNEKARKEMAKVKGQKNPHFEEKQKESDIAKSLADAYRAVHEEGYGAPGHNPGSGEKSVARAKALMDKKGQKGAPGLDAMMAANKEHKARRGVKKEELELDENRRAARAAGGYKDDSKKQNDPSKAGFTGIGNMSIDQIRKMSARMDKEKTQKEGLDPVGQEDGDIDNDGKKDKTDKYLMNRRKAIGKAIKGKMKKEDFIPEVMTDSEDDKPIKEKKVKNVIKVNPKLGESVEEIGGELIEAVEIVDILEEITDQELRFVSDRMIDEVVEEFFIEAAEQDEDLEVLQQNLCESIDLSISLLLEQDAGAEARKRLGSGPSRASVMDRVKSAVKKGAKVARKAVVKGSEVAGKAVGHTKNLVKDMGSAAKKGYQSTQSGSSDSSSSSDSGSSSSSSSAPKKPGLLSRIGAKLKRGIGKAARAVSRGSRNLARKMDEAVYGGTPPEKKDTRMVVTNADKKANTPAYQKMKAGDKRYKAADHMDEEKKPLPKNKMFRKAGNLGREVVSPSVSDDQRQKAYDRSKKIVKTLNKANEEVEVDEAMSSYDKNRKRAAQRAADRNAARAAGKTGVVPGVGYVTARKEKETYTDEKGTVRHKSGARNEEVEAEGYEPMTPERKLRVDRAKRGAYDKDQRAQYQGDKKEADKQFKRRMAMDSRTKMKEDAAMSPQEIQLQKKKAMLDRMIAQKRQQGLNKVKKSEAPAKAMGEETEDSLRDRRMERGGVDGNVDYRRPAKNVAMGGGKKKPYDGMSALEKVKASIRAKHGQGAIMDTKKK